MEVREYLQRWWETWQSADPATRARACLTRVREDVLAAGVTDREECVAAWRALRWKDGAREVLDLLESPEGQRMAEEDLDTPELREALAERNRRSEVMQGLLRAEVGELRAEIQGLEAEGTTLQREIRRLEKQVATLEAD